MKSAKKAVKKAAAQEKKTSDKGKKNPSGQTGKAQIMGNIGLYYTCMRLSAMELNVAPTARNAAGVDVIVYGQNSTKPVSIQVKTVKDKHRATIGKQDRKIHGNFWVVVADAGKIGEEDRPSCYVLKASEVMNRRSTGGGNSWLMLGRFADCRDAWGKILRAVR